jgi:hypothetical protein
MRAFRLLSLAALAALLAACASSHTLIGSQRPAIDPAQVRFYYDPPEVPFEEIALLDVSSGAFTYGEQNKSDAIRRRLREEAAKLGANGVIFRGAASGYGRGGVSVGAGGGRIGGSSYGGVGVGVNISPEQKYARGVAIHVPNPPPETRAAEPVPQD